MKRSLAVFVLTFTLIGLTACNGNNDTRNNLNNRNNVGVNNTNNNNNNFTTGRNVANQNLRVSTRAIRNVERLKEVDRAHVIVRNNDAYVAVSLTNNGRNNNGTNGRTDTRTGNQMNTQTNRDRTGTNVRNNISDTAINNENTGTTRNNTNMGTNGFIGSDTNAGANGVGLSGKAGTNTGLSGTDINRNTEDGGPNYRNVSSRLEQKIADQVRAADKNIHKVYVSYDQNFYNQMTTYANDLRNGQNRDGIWNDFADTIRRVFR